MATLQNFVPGSQAWYDFQNANPGAAKAANMAPNPFNPNSNQANNMKPNPFKPGTREYADFQNEQISSAVKMAGSPERPGFDSQIDPATGLLKGNLQLSDSSKWGALLKQQLEGQRLQRMDQNDAQAQGANAAASSSLAMRGGLGSGARTSLAKDMARNINAGAQGINRDISNQGLGVDINQEQNNLAAQKFNIGNALGEKFQERAANLGSYSEAMKAWAADKTANAQSGGSPSLCFITTAVCDYLGLSDDNAFLNTFRKFRDEHLGGKEKVSKYYEIAPKIVEKMNGDLEAMNHILTVHLLPAFLAIKQNNFQKAEDLYSAMVLELEETYLKGDTHAVAI